MTAKGYDEDVHASEKDGLGARCKKVPWPPLVLLSLLIAVGYLATMINKAVTYADDIYHSTRDAAISESLMKQVDQFGLKGPAAALLSPMIYSAQNYGVGQMLAEVIAEYDPRGALGAKRVHLNLVTRLTLALGDETRLKTRLFTDETAQVEQLGATNLIDWQKKETRASVDGSRARGPPVDETRAHHRERTTPQTRETNTRIKT